MDVSLRSLETEQRYRTRTKRTPLAEVPTIKEFEHWVIINNEYPYDYAFKTHHMLLPRRVFGSRSEINLQELMELQHIMQDYVEPTYDTMMDNTNQMRSMPDHYHIHLLKHYDSREDMKL